MSFTFLHAADVHLDSPLHGLQRYEGAPVETIRLASRRALENLVECAITRKVDFVLLAGDLYDGDWRDYNTPLFFVSQAKRLQDAGIPLILIAGNHDAQNKMTRSLQLPENTRMLTADAPQTIDFEDLGVAIHGQSFATQAVLHDLSLGYPPARNGVFNIGLLHTSATGAEGHDTYAPCTIGGLQSRNYHYWALGHVHQRQMLCDQPWVAFPGNIQGRKITETGPKGCLIVTVDGKLSATPEFVPLDVLRWERLPFDVSDFSTLDEAWSELGAKLRSLDQAANLPQAVRIQLQGATPLHERILSRRDQVEADIRSLAIQSSSERLWIEKISVHTRPQTVAALTEDSELPQQELALQIEKLKAHPEELEALGSDIFGLLQKLGDDRVLADEGLSARNRSGLAGLLEDVEALLMNRLASGEEQSCGSSR